MELGSNGAAAHHIRPATQKGTEDWRGGATSATCDAAWSAWPLTTLPAGAWRTSAQPPSAAMERTSASKNTPPRDDIFIFDSRFKGGMAGLDVAKSAPPASGLN